MSLTPENLSTARFNRNSGLVFAIIGIAIAGVTEATTGAFSGLYEHIEAKIEGVKPPTPPEMSGGAKAGQLFGLMGGSLATLAGLFSATRSQLWIWTGNNKAVDKYRENLMRDIYP